MSTPKDADRVKLISSIFSPSKDVITSVATALERMFGPVDWKSAQLLFDRTRYYEREMGWPLFRRIVAFRDLIRPESIVDVKLKTNELEKAFARDGKRSVNLDPGYISMERLVLVTGKNYTHRVYLSKGIYADLTLIFQRGCFRPLPWTYRDYGAEEMISRFNEIRNAYKGQLRNGVA